MKPRRQQFGSTAMTLEQGMLQFRMFLANATDERLLAMTIDRAMAMYRMDKRKAEYALLIAQQKRREEIAGRAEV